MYSNQLLDSQSAGVKLQRMALEIAEQLHGDDAGIILLGIRNSGLIIAKQLAAYLKEYRKNIQVNAIKIDKQNPQDVSIEDQPDLNGKNVIVVDDVTNSGRTLMYAMKPLLNYYPKRIQTLVLVERMHKLFPVKPDYVGMQIATTADSFIVVEVKQDQVTAAFIA